SPAGRRAGRPPATSVARIVAAARTLIDRDGWENLTIRKLAGELGVGPTTLYHHVRDKDDLLVHLINDLAARTPRPELPDDPRDRMVTAAEAAHRMLTGWPWAVEVITTDGFLGRVDESAAWSTEAIVGAALELGCEREQAVYVFRTIWFYLVGEILVRARSARAPLDLDRLPERTFFAGAGMSRLPHLAEIGDDWIAIERVDTFRQGLEALVDGLLAQLLGITRVEDHSGRTPPTPPTTGGPARPSRPAG